MTRQDAPVARLSLGALRGAWENDTAVFRGVRYAEPPLGVHRFAPPVPIAAWQGTREATANGPIAPQPPSRLTACMGNFSRPQAEDCLTLTVWTPALDDKARPVLVWIHGGAYMTGAGSLDWYDGGELSREGDIVVVGVNYRLGALGFLHRPGLSEGNLGLLDQQEALAWVKAHIAVFGGDPDQVTIGGQSAGGGSIAYLLTMPKARSLFHRAIIESAPLGRPPVSSAQATAKADRYLGFLGIDAGAADAVDRLRETPAEKLVEAQVTLARTMGKEGDMSLPFGPVGSGTLEQFLAAVAEGAQGKEAIVGSTHDEMHGFFVGDPAMDGLDHATAASRFVAITGDATLYDTYRRRNPEGSAMDLFGALITERNFAAPTLRLADAMASRGEQVWAYRFDWAPQGSKFHACHCIELPLLFGNQEAWSTAPMLAGGDAGEIVTVSGALRDAWLHFIREGVPSSRRLPAWPAYHADRPAQMRFDRSFEVIEGTAA